MGRHSGVFSPLHFSSGPSVLKFCSWNSFVKRWEVAYKTVNFPPSPKMSSKPLYVTFILSLSMEPLFPSHLPNPSTWVCPICSVPSCRFADVRSNRVCTHTLFFFPLNFSAWFYYLMSEIRTGEAVKEADWVQYTPSFLFISPVFHSLSLDQSPQGWYLRTLSSQLCLPYTCTSLRSLPPYSEPFLVLQSIKMHLFSATVSFSFIDDESTIEFQRTTTLSTQDEVMYSLLRRAKAGFPPAMCILIVF